MTESVLPDRAPEKALDIPATDEAERAAELTRHPVAEADPADVVEQVREAAPGEDAQLPPGNAADRGLEVDDADAWEGAAEVGPDDDDRR
jgi:hypothetical protein